MRSSLTYFAALCIMLVCAAGFYQVYEKAGLPVVLHPGSLVIDEVKKPSALQADDRLLSIDGMRVASIDEVEFVLDTKTAGRTARIVVERGGIFMSTDAALERFFPLRYLVIQLVTVSVFIFLGLFVYTKRKEDPAARMFNWVSLFAALILAATWGKFTVAPSGTGHVIRAVFHLAYACTGVLFIHFTLVFPSVPRQRPLRLLGILYAMALGLTAAATYYFLEAARTMNAESFTAYNTAFNAMRLYFVACMLTGLVIVMRTYTTAREESERRKLRWILLGLAAGPLCFIALWIVPQVFTSRGIVDEEFIILLMLSVPVTFAISIVKYHILNIDQIFKRTTVYTLALSAVLVLYIVIVSVSSLIVGTFTVTSSLIASTVAAAAVAALFQPIRERTQLFVDRKFFNVRYNYREAEKQFIEQIVFCCNEASICGTVTTTIDRLMPNPGTRLCLLHSGGSDAPGEALLASLRVHEAPLFLGECIELGANFMPADAGLLGGRGAAAAFRIFSESSGLLGCLLLRPKLSGFRYNLEDVDLLESFCRQTALALERVSLQHSLITEQLEKKRLKELNELKSYFVSSVTHELKTPLTSISLFTELIEESPNLKKEKRGEYLQIIKSESGRLARLIDNVLDLSKIEKGMMEYRFADVDLNECVSQAVRAMQFQFTLHGFDCRTRLARKKLLIRADQDAVLEVIFNLLTNAIKYADGKKKILVSTRQLPEGAKLEVADRGAGIEEDDLGKIFEPFERTDSRLARQTSGTGLGLALVRHIADAHKAIVGVRSRPGKGSAFSITFPFTTSGSAA